MKTSQLLRAGLWDQHPGLVQLLGLCPLLAVSTSLGRALALAMATFVVLATSNVLAALVGRLLPAEVRIATFVMMVAALVTSVELVYAAHWPALHDALGIYLPLIAVNCLLLGRAETFASRAPVGQALVDGLAMGAGFALSLLALGTLRELLGQGTLGGDLRALFAFEGHAAAGLQFFGRHAGFQLVLLPAGALILLGLVLAGRQAWSAARSGRTTVRAAADPRIENA
jgi:electron transport complex protein RnfE